MSRVHVESNISLRPAVSIFCFLSVLLFRSFAANAQQPGIPFEHYTVNDGLPSQLTYAVRQDRQGFIWICTESGVSRFDGKRFVNFTTEDGLGDNENLEMYEDRKGRLWFIPFSGKLSYYYKGKFHSEKNDSIIRLLPDHYINCGMSMTEDVYGNIYIPDADLSKGVTRLGPDNKIFIYNLKPVVRNRFDTPGVIYTSPDGKRVYCRPTDTVERLMQLLSSGEVRELKVRPGKYHNDTRRFRPNIDLHSVLFCGNDSLYSVEDTFFRALLPVSCYYDPVLSDFKNDNYGNVWQTGIGSVRFFRKRNGTYDKPLLLIGDQRCNVYFDKEDNIWIATATRGLYMTSYSRLNDAAAFDINSKSLNKRLLSIAADRDNGIWLGYDNGYISRCKDGRCEHYNLMETGGMHLPGNYERITQINIDGDGDVWCISNKFAVKLQRLSADHYAAPRALYHYDSSLGRKVLAFGFKFMYLDNKKNICLSTAFSWKFFNKTKINKKTMVLPVSAEVKMLSPLRQYTAFSDSKGGLYASMMNGLHYSINNKETILSVSDKRLKVRVQNFAENSEGVIFMATYSDGLIALKDLKIQAIITKSSGLPGIVCKRLYCIRDTLYLATNGGISVLVFERDSFRVLYNLGVKEGLSSLDVNDLALLGHTLYAATSTGLSTFKLPFTGVAMASAPIPVFTGFKVNEKQYDVNEPITFPFGQQRISISYIAPVAAYASRLQYRYRFADREESWHTTSSDVLEFNKLPSATYRLEIQAKRFNSDWGASQMIMFRITPPFYNSWWFMLLLVLSLAVFVWLIFRSVLRRRLRQQLAQLKEKEAVERERQRIAADIHDDIGSELTNIMILSKMLKNKESQQAGSAVIEKIEASSSEVITKMNEVIWTLNTGNDTLFDLGAYLRDYAGRFAEKYNTRINIYIDDRIYEDYNLNSGQRRDVFLVVKEILHNTVKHAHGDQVLIEVLRPAENRLKVSISDNGRGFDTAKEYKGNGIKNIRERVKKLRGDIEIHSQQGKGTSIVFSIPI